MLANILNRFTDLSKITVNHPVRDIHRFLKLLQRLNTAVGLVFYQQPQNLFDQLPQYLPFQKLTICSSLSDLAFLFELKNLTILNLQNEKISVDAEFVEKFFKSSSLFPRSLSNFAPGWSPLTQLLFHYKSASGSGLGIG